jgi:NADPH2:quinone reductase
VQAIRVHASGGPEVMALEEVAVPEPGPGQARVKVAAAGVNFVDVYYRIGLYPVALPFTPGVEAAGVVDAVGSGVTEVKAGDRVAYSMDQGTYADYALVTAWKLVPIPDAVDFQQAATLMVQGMTAHFLACSTYPLGPTDTALVHAAAGGVGQILVQIAKQRGARVIATVSTEEKARIARDVGADDVIMYTSEDFEARTRELTDGHGVEVVYDGVGKSTFEQSINSLRPRGYMVSYGNASGAVPPVAPLVLMSKGSLFLTRPTMGHYMLNRDELLERANDLFRWTAEGALRLRIDRTWPLSEAGEAHRYLEGRGTKGKVLLVP